MEPAGPSKSSSQKPLTNRWPDAMPLRFRLRGIFFAWCILISSIFGLPLFFLPAIILIRPFSQSLWRKYSTAVASTWFSSFLFLFEQWNGFEYHVTGDQIPSNEFCFAISNHPSEADWLFYWSLARRYHDMSRHRIVLKDIMRKAFGIGWAIEFMEFIFLARDWKEDKAQLVYSCRNFLTSPFPLFVLLFPEGTDFTLQKHKRSVEFAEKNGLESYQNLLVPRVKGFTTTLNTLRPRLDAVYDLTIAYGTNGVTPTMWSAWCGWLHHHTKYVTAAIRRSL
eukprot:TRINITY_DN5835_c0_g1_i3.p1 TRINITY_DN5835_c0_g1~~TRINITY_DN5835_c0_g1_i3.p1  ORF type:complete len:287 (-),score=25.61 TRINITY_DN5835_c0_g1_i3:13-852(-)